MSKVNILDDLKNQTSEKIEAIKKILPDCFDKDGNLIGEKLKEILSGDFEKPDTERFTFNWAGKQKARETAYKTYCDGTLKFDKTRSKNFDETQNLIIEGDNLQVLKLLKNSYKGKVKCIYIDPPYNTGSDFVYNDKFELDIQKYLIETGEIDIETGEQITDYIQKDDGKKHSKWLSFMYPRLMAAREMLQEDGVIFISIDDNEVHHLRLLMNEVFGEECFICDFIRKTKTMSGDDGYGIVKQHDNILVFAKDNTKLNGEEKNYDAYSNPDNDPNGDWTSGDPSAKSGSTGTYFEIINPYTQQIDLPPKGRYWAFSKETMERYIQSGRIKFKNEIKSNQRGFVFKRYKNELQSSYNSLETLFGCDNKFMNEVGNDDIINIFGMSLFDYPKPVNLIKNLIKSSTAPNDLILDFFAGSGTTGQAVMELNQEELDKAAKDGLLAEKMAQAGGRKFILVQLPEKIDEKKEAFKAGYTKISDITIERVRRAGQKYSGVDNGFKVLGLSENPDRENLWSLGNLHDNDFIFTHLALLYGYGLNYKLEKIAEKEIFIMKSEIEATKDAIVIMERNPLTMEDILSLIKSYGKGEYKFFSRDCALNIELTYNLLQHFKEDNVIVF